MIQRETAIKSAENRRLEAPELRRLLDYQIGDIVQLKKAGKYSGKIGVIIGVRAFSYNDSGEYDLAYTIKLSDSKSIEVSGQGMRFLRHADEPKTEKEI